MRLLAAKARVNTLALPAGVRLRRRGPLLFAFNYGDTPWTLENPGEIILGDRDVKPQGVTILRLA
jgi:beta-galactosidase